jgi:release factor glutamine methyltransferase
MYIGALSRFRDTLQLLGKTTGKFRMEETWTILGIIQWTTAYFSRKGVEQPRSNAEVLLGHVLGMSRIDLYIHFDKPLSSEELGRFREAVKRRAGREPTQYITRKQEFWSLEFEVTPAVLIPRPETEWLVEKALEIIGDDPATVLDLCTGSGAVAVALAFERPSLTVVATDLSNDALIVARRNAVRHAVADRVHFALMDLFGGFNPRLLPFDVIVCNPPYIGETEFPALAPEVGVYEPELALRGGGPEGLNLIRSILSQFTNHLKPGGSLFVEIGMGQAEILPGELEQFPGMESYRFIRDYAGVLRVLHCIKVR